MKDDNAMQSINKSEYDNTCPPYPDAFRGANVYGANDMLRQGLATEADAAQLVRWWNESGKRTSVARLHFYSRPLGDVGMRICEVVVSDF